MLSGNTAQAPVGDLCPLAIRGLGRRTNPADRRRWTQQQPTTYSLHAYRFDQKVLGSRDAGIEAGIDFLVEAPKGVKTTLGLGYLLVGDALKPFFKEDPYVISLKTSVTLK